MRYDCLIIDDEKLFADSAAEYFNLLGVSTAVVYDVKSCRSFLKENSAGLLLLDINLGDESGFGLCREGLPGGILRLTFAARLSIMQTD